MGARSFRIPAQDSTVPRGAERSALDCDRSHLELPGGAVLFDDGGLGAVRRLVDVCSCPGVQPAQRSRTAVTRGRRKVYIVGEPAAYAMAVRNGESKLRITHLREKLAAAAVT